MEQQTQQANQQINQTVPTGQECIIECANVNKNYTLGKSSICALKDINFSIEKGEFIILFGPSGAGKTTLLNLLAGLDRVTSGNIIVNGQDITQLSDNELAEYRATKIGMVFQEFNLINQMSALDNVSLPMVFTHIGLKSRNSRAKTLLSSVELDNRIMHKPVEMSGGEKQRVAIVRALVNDPMILLVDEPTGNLDTISADQVMKILYNLNKKLCKTLILVTHNPNYLPMADRVFVMKDGKIINELIDKKTKTNYEIH
jgi:putative ABC transport system ATP-binding protein